MESARSRANESQFSSSFAPKKTSVGSVATVSSVAVPNPLVAPASATPTAPPHIVAAPRKCSRFQCGSPSPGRRHKYYGDRSPRRDRRSRSRSPPWTFPWGGGGTDGEGAVHNGTTNRTRSITSIPPQYPSPSASHSLLPPPTPHPFYVQPQNPPPP